MAAEAQEAAGGDEGEGHEDIPEPGHGFRFSEGWTRPKLEGDRRDGFEEGYEGSWWSSGRKLGISDKGWGSVARRTLCLNRCSVRWAASTWLHVGQSLYPKPYTAIVWLFG